MWVGTKIFLGFVFYFEECVSSSTGVISSTKSMSTGQHNSPTSYPADVVNYRTFVQSQISSLEQPQQAQQALQPQQLLQPQQPQHESVWNSDCALHDGRNGGRWSVDPGTPLLGAATPATPASPASLATPATAATPATGDDRAHCIGFVSLQTTTL